MRCENAPLPQRRHQRAVGLDRAAHPGLPRRASAQDRHLGRPRRRLLHPPHRLPVALPPQGLPAQDELTALGDRLGWKTAKRYAFAAVSELLTLARTLPSSEEGFVPRFSSGLRPKVKCLRKPLDFQSPMIDLVDRCSRWPGANWPLVSPFATSPIFSLRLPVLSHESHHSV
jgi:hypothetical protein